ANTTATTTAVTNGSGVATASTFTANGTAGGPYTVSASAGAASANFSLTNDPGPATSVSIVSGDTQDAVVGTSFANPLEVLVQDAHGNHVGSGVTVTFTAPESDPTASFGASNTDSQTTNSIGVATSSTPTAGN